MRRNSNALEPIVLDGCTVEQFLEFLIRHPSTWTELVVCSSRDEFLKSLLDEVTDQSATMHGLRASDAAMETEDPAIKPAGVKSSMSSLMVPTLSLLASSRRVTVSFCPDLTHLLAHLSVLPSRQHDTSRTHISSATDQKCILAILNPIRLHQPTSSFSAQGFNRTIASAVEAAYDLRRQLVLIEAPERAPDPSDHDVLMHDSHAGPVGDVPEADAQRLSSPWDQPLSMLNVTTKTFGVGERGWVGRTVTIRQVAERWCRFTTLDETGFIE